MESDKNLKVMDWIKISIYILIYVLIISVSAFFLIPGHLIIWIILCVGGILLFFECHRRKFAYRCPVCDNEFQVSLFTDLVSPHGPGWKYLKCPKCHRRVRARLIKKTGRKPTQLG